MNEYREFIRKLLEAKMAADQLPDKSSRDIARRMYLQTQISKLIQNIEAWEKSSRQAA